MLKLAKIASLFVLIIGLQLGSNQKSQAQDLKVSGYIDAYIATDNDYNFKDNEKRQFSFVNNSKNQFGLNTAMITLNASGKDYRGTFSLHEGGIKQTAWDGFTSTPNIYEANFGVSPMKDLWIDAGYFITHIGAEGVLPKDNLMSSHSLSTYFGPFYQSGVKISYNFSEDFLASLHILNGNGIFEDNNANKTLGWFLSYNIKSANLTASVSGVIGNEDLGTNPARTAQFHNVVLLYTPIEDLQIKGQLDYASLENGAIDESTFKPKTGAFMGFALQAKYALTKSMAVSARFSSADNKDGIRASDTDPNKYKQALVGTDITLGLEYKTTANSFFRLEGRMINLDDKYEYFKDADGKATNSRSEIMLNYGIWF